MYFYKGMGVKTFLKLYWLFYKKCKASKKKEMFLNHARPYSGEGF